MAKAAKANSKKKKLQKRKRKVTMTLLLGIASFLFLATFYVSFSVLFVGLIPTYLTYICDMQQKKNMTKTVCWMNSAGVILVMLQLWSVDANSIRIAIDIMSDWVNWMIIVSCSLVGLCLNLIIPPMVESYLELSYQVKLKGYYKEKEQLEEDWGEGISRYSDLKTLDDLEQNYLDIKTKEKNIRKKRQLKQSLHEKATNEVVRKV